MHEHMAIPCCAARHSVSTQTTVLVVSNVRPVFIRLGSQSYDRALTRWVKNVTAQVLQRYSQYPGKPGIKTLNYGEGPKKLAAKLGVEIEYAKELIEKYFKPYPLVRDHIEWTHKQARTGIIETVLGRPRRIPELIHLGEYSFWDLTKTERIAVSRAERQSTNSEIQGSAADVARMAMIRCEHDLDLQDLGVEMLLQIHDELIFEVPEENIKEAIPLIREDMEHPFNFELAIPLQVDIGTGQSWASAKA